VTAAAKTRLERPITADPPPVAFNTHTHTHTCTSVCYRYHLILQSPVHSIYGKLSKKPCLNCVLSLVLWSSVIKATFAGCIALESPYMYHHSTPLPSFRVHVNTALKSGTSKYRDWMWGWLFLPSSQLWLFFPFPFPHPYQWRILRGAELAPPPPPFG